MNTQPMERKARRRLRNLAVDFISLVRSGANRRQFVAKAAEPFVLEVPVAKLDAPRRMVYGVVYAPDEVDTQGDTMAAGEVEKAAYEFMQMRRTTHVDVDHDGKPDRGYVAESWLVRKQDPLFPDEPEGSWAVGIRVTDEAAWERIESGSLRGLSLAGTACAEPITRSADPGALEILQKEIEQLRARVEAVEKHTPGRQTTLGEENPAVPRSRGLRIL